MPLTYGALCALAEKHNVTITENMRAFVREVEDQDRRDQAAAQQVPLAAEHKGMRVDYRGLLRQAQDALRSESALAEMLRQLQAHMTELGRRWYAGDVAAVDEFLQLYCVEVDLRAHACAIAAAAQPHADAAAVDRFAIAMKGKLEQAREKGRSGWEQCDPVELSIMLREHVEKGDPIDVANFCMFLWNLGKPISDAALPCGKRVAPAPLHLGASLTDGTLHVIAMRHEDGASTVVATADLEVDALAKTDCHAVMKAEPVGGERVSMAEINAAWDAFNKLIDQNDTWRMGAAIKAARAAQSGQRAGVPDALPIPETIFGLARKYAEGWNACRDAMLATHFKASPARHSYAERELVITGDFSVVIRDAAPTQQHEVKL